MLFFEAEVEKEAKKLSFKRLIYRLLLPTMAVLFALPMQAQSLSYREAVWAQPRSKSTAQMGLMVGAGYMFVEPDETLVALSPKLGVRAALAMSICWRERYAVQMELAYAYNKIEARLDDIAAYPDAATYDVKVGVMEIPLIFSYRALWPVRFNLGVLFSVASAGRYDLPSERIEFGQLRPTVGYVAGIGVSLTRNLLLDARYTGSFADTSNYFEGIEFSTRSHWLTLSVGYMF